MPKRYKKNDRCVVCLKPLKGKYKYCSLHCMPVYYRKDLNVKSRVRIFKGQCTERIQGYNGVQRCVNMGLPHKDGKCNECYLWTLRRQGIYPHKDNATRCTEVYLVL